MRVLLALAVAVLLSGCAQAPAGAPFENAAPSGATDPECFRLIADKAAIAPGEAVRIASVRNCPDTRKPECGGPLPAPIVYVNGEKLHVGGGAAGPPLMHPAICMDPEPDPRVWSWNGTVRGERRTPEGGVSYYGPEDAPPGDYRIETTRTALVDGSEERWSAWVVITLVAP